ncbi:type VI secretion system-associated protein VasI [Vibrio algivorus]|uniref:Type VI secretion-associated protein n=1 Tax=Vibrio algivorus TaxID=1667024 RepID=A0ABQ6EKM0_9VIBR|nr:type VI secretion system-associated protein VasI [Vibrio algivorus]GLT13678.1 type VI secretion-associated protein [Vibrio algivorus]
MNYQFNTVIFTLILFQLFFVNDVRAEQRLILNEAKACTSITARLERLDCFDRIFNTSLPEITSLKEVKPEAWSRGMAVEQSRIKGDMFPLISNGNGKTSSDIWVTLPAVNHSEDGQNAVLMMSCINNISHLDLLLHKNIEQARVNVSANTFKSSLWKTDDSGFVISSSRGVFAIGMMKSISLSSSLDLSSDIESINGLKFNTENLSKVLIPLRKSCGW